MESMIDLNEIIDKQKSSLDFLKKVEEVSSEKSEIKSKLKISIEIEIENNSENREFIFNSLLTLRTDCCEVKGTMITQTNEVREKEITIDYIQKVVCTYFSVPVEMLQSSTRKREIVQARQIAMYFSKNLTKSSLATIGSQIGDKDHATVLHAIKTINNFLEINEFDSNGKQKMRDIIDEIEMKLKQ